VLMLFSTRRTGFNTRSKAEAAPVNLFLCELTKGGSMKFCTILAVMVALVTFIGSSQGAQILQPPNQVQIAARLFTAPVLEPNGSIAVCFATNLDSVARVLDARIINSSGVDVTQTSFCGAPTAAGGTCESTAPFANNSSLRCVVGTSGAATTLRGALTTSTSGAFPFTGPANLSVPAQ
jgi:hypothetical protein